MSWMLVVQGAGLAAGACAVGFLLGCVAGLVALRVRR